LPGRAMPEGHIQPGTALNRTEVRRMRLFDLELVRHQHPGQEWVPHWHTEWSFGAVTQGECRCSVAGQPFLPRAGDLIAIAPHTVHTGVLTAASASNSVLVMMLYVPSEWLLREELTPPARSGLIRAPTLARQARNLTSVSDVQTWLRNAVPKLSNALRPTSAVPLDPAPTDAVRNLLERIRSAILGGAWNVSGLASQCGVSRERIHQVMTRWIGMSPSDYLRTVRLHRAKDMLLKGQSVAAVAAACGFADQAHFTRWFRRAFGYTPGDLVQASLQRMPAMEGQ
jgi:AraC-like DNA-binding protein/quercetin dioxygenase-like cupin family protein